MAKRKPKGRTHAKKPKQPRKPKSPQQRGAITRRKNAEHQRTLAEKAKRSEAAKRGWITRRANEPVRRTNRIRESLLWQRWIYEHRVNITGTYLFPHDGDRLRRNGEEYLRNITREIFHIAHERYPNARSYGGTILYKRSTDGKTWEQGIISKYIPWQQKHETFQETVEQFEGQVINFLRDVINPDPFEHAYRVKIVGLAVRILATKVDIGYAPAQFPENKIPNMVSLTRRERTRRQLGY